MMVVGIDFTEYTAQSLLQRGFAAATMDDSDIYRRFIFPLECDDGRFSGFEIHVVHDEIGYLDRFQKHHFFPYVSENTVPNRPIVQPNGIAVLSKILTYDELDDRKLRRYLEIRKGFDLPALLFTCKSIELFVKIAMPDLRFEIDGRPAALIHLGPSCFDLVVVESI